MTPSDVFWLAATAVGMVGTARHMWQTRTRPEAMRRIAASRSHVRRVPVAERPRSLAQDAWCSLAGGTELEARVFRAQRMVASHRTFGDQALRRTR